MRCALVVSSAKLDAIHNVITMSSLVQEVAYAHAAQCTVPLKPLWHSPSPAQAWLRILHEGGVKEVSVHRMLPIHTSLVTAPLPSPITGTAAHPARGRGEGGQRAAALAAPPHPCAHQQRAAVVLHPGRCVNSKLTFIVAWPGWFAQICWT